VASNSIRRCILDDVLNLSPVSIDQNKTKIQTKSRTIILLNFFPMGIDSEQSSQVHRCVKELSLLRKEY
jgi:hypothetical protein